jgi:hypothetical protein
MVLLVSALLHSVRWLLLDLLHIGLEARLAWLWFLLLLLSLLFSLLDLLRSLLRLLVLDGYLLIESLRNVLEVLF